MSEDTYEGRERDSEEEWVAGRRRMNYENALNAITRETGKAARRVSWEDPEACIWWDGRRLQYSRFQGRGTGWSLTPEDEEADDWITDCEEEPVIPEGEEEGTPLQAARGRFVQAKIDAGWVSGERGTTHPADAGLWFLVDPMSGEITFSRKLASIIDEDADAEEMLRLIREELQQRRESGHA